MLKFTKLMITFLRSSPCASPYAKASSFAKATEDRSGDKSSFGRQARLGFVILISFLSPALNAQASVLADMQKFFNKFGALTNLSSGGAYDDQSAGYMTGGSLFVRNPVRSQQVASVTTPGYRAGCGGIDIWTGGLSYIKNVQLKNVMQSIVSNVTSYAFMLAVETYAPQIHTIMHQLTREAEAFNRLNINSCEAAAGILGGIWPKSDLGSQAVCRMVASHSGEASDWAKARHQCGSSTTHAATVKATHPDLLVGEFNLAWKILGQADFLLVGDDNPLNVMNFAAEAAAAKEAVAEAEQEEKRLGTSWGGRYFGNAEQQAARARATAAREEARVAAADAAADAEAEAKPATKGDTLLKEIFMTLSGTVINRKVGPEDKDGNQKEQQVTLEYQGSRENLIKGLMQGGQIQYYKCDEPTKCLRPEIATVTLPPTSSLQVKITKMLERIAAKVRNDDGNQVITPAEKSLINASHIPIYKIINVTVAYQKGRAPLNIMHHAELIAFDVAYKYINDVFDLFQDGVNRLKAIQFTDVHINPFVAGIRKARQLLMNHRSSAIAKMDLLLGFIQKTELIERQIYSMLGTLSNEYGG